MITTSGNLFHIDFGHFLGNIKYFLVKIIMNRILSCVSLHCRESRGSGHLLS